ncbi:hypothetical protein PIB30_026834 [Stylosanthes scabra]|uniref:Ribonuclease H1 N-terminal domain-containing protein n=1 Tax=Stylosanthes scabra TaxID=79078 RepID=A0ABU6RAS0_9FABA|nr:hypothetical protein [Stylosanthes scabra]
MEPTFRAFRFFAVTIGKNSGVYDSLEEACSQLVGFPKAEYQGFNSSLLAEGAFTARIDAIQDEKECVEEMQALLGNPKMSPPPSLPYVPTADGRIAPLQGGVNRIPVDKVASFPFPMCVDIEHWLAKICYETSLLPPAYFRKEVALVTGGVAYRFSVVIPGNPLGVRVHATGRYSALESDAKEDATFYMLQKLLHATGQPVRDYNYLTAKSLLRDNVHLGAEIECLEERTRHHGYDTELDDITP